jgi:queuosine precursor transporter
MEQEIDLKAWIKLSRHGRDIWSATGAKYVCLYLIAIVAANLIISRYGPAASIVTAFFCIGLDLTARDHLHEAWHKRGLVWKMTALIGAGSVISWMLNADAGRIALASFAAFALAGIADTLAYSALFARVRLIKINGSNIAGALVDSIAFPTLAFGAFMPWIVIGQLAAKVAGGFIWSLILIRSQKS